MTRLGTTFEDAPVTIDTRARKIFVGVALLAALVVGGCMTRGVVENVDADEILVVQSVASGHLNWYVSPGIKPQWWGTTTSYKKRGIYEFQAPVQFNDGGKGVIHGSVQYDMPVDEKNLTELHTRYRGMEGVQKLMEVVTNKVVYMTGPVMSSRESYAEKRNYLISYAQDQIDHGVYRTARVVREELDAISGQKKAVNVAEIVQGKDGRPERQEASVVGEFGIRAFNFAIVQIDYDDVVEKQIADQQRITMEVQTSIAEALKAQQRASTVEQQGRADAAAAKWAEEKVKASAIVKAEQAKEVQEMAVLTAKAYAQEQTLRSEADASARRRLLEADGALAAKLATLEKINATWAQAFQHYAGQIVPSVTMGGSGGPGGNSFQQMMELLTVKAALDLGVNVKPSGGRGAGPGDK